jgi:hypothetical protein
MMYISVVFFILAGVIRLTANKNDYANYEGSCMLTWVFTIFGTILLVCGLI